MFKTSDKATEKPATDRQRLAAAREALVATIADPRANLMDRLVAVERGLLELLRIAEAR
jgi:hypothetical protein